MTDSTPSSERAEFPARLTAVADTAAFAHAFCHRNGIDRADALRLALVLEELFTNTVRHGHRGESDAPVRIELALSDRGIGVLYEDAAPRYDPLAGLSATPPHLDAVIEARPVGGLGVHLLGRLVADARYAYEGGRNRLRLTLTRSDRSLTS